MLEILYSIETKKSACVSIYGHVRENINKNFLNYLRT